MRCSSLKPSRISLKKSNLRQRMCNVVEEKRPFRRITYQNVPTNKNCILGSSLVFGCFLRDAVTISCPGGVIATMCTNQIMKELRIFGVKNVIVMAGTNNLFDKENKRLMGPVETSDEMHYLITKLQFEGFNVGIMRLISRKGKHETIHKVNSCYVDVADELNVPFFNQKRFRYRKHISSDKLHPAPEHCRELALDFLDGFKVLEKRTRFRC